MCAERRRIQIIPWIAHDPIQFRNIVIGAGVVMVINLFLVLAVCLNGPMILIGFSIILLTCLAMALAVKGGDPDWANYDTMRVVMSAEEFNDLVKMHLTRIGIDAIVLAEPLDDGYVTGSHYKMLDPVSELAIYTRNDRFSTLVTLGKKTPTNKPHMDMFKKLVYEALSDAGDVDVIEAG
jgi:hypothetical protein